MKSKIFIITIVLPILFSCGKKYQCNCYSTNDGKLVYSYTDRTKRTDHAQTDCETAYHGSSSFVSPSYCEIK